MSIFNYLLQKGTPPLVVAQCYNMGPGVKLDPLVMLGEAKRICDNLVSQKSNFIGYQTYFRLARQSCTTCDEPAAFSSSHPAYSYLSATCGGTSASTSNSNITSGNPGRLDVDSRFCAIHQRASQSSKCDHQRTNICCTA